MSFTTYAVDGHEHPVPARARGAWRKLLRTEAKLLLREPTAVFWAVAIPADPYGRDGRRGRPARQGTSGVSASSTSMCPSRWRWCHDPGGEAMPAISRATARRASCGGCRRPRCGRRRCSGQTRRSTFRVIGRGRRDRDRRKARIRRPPADTGLRVRAHAGCLRQAAMIALGNARRFRRHDNADRAGTRDAPVLPDDVLRRPVGAAAADVERAAARERASRRWAPRPQRSRTRCTDTGPGSRTWRSSRAMRSCSRSQPLGCSVGSRIRP